MRPYTREELQQLEQIQRIAKTKAYLSMMETPLKDMPVPAKVCEQHPVTDFETREWFECREFHRIMDEEAAEVGLRVPREVWRKGRVEWTECL